MLKISFSYDLPTYDPKKHDPDKKFVLLTYRGIHYAKWVYLKSMGAQSWKVFKRG
jgi:hypothetical protein|tara:strand:+ start:527 stop:691 length:165 start_codon:yes stop_codon:yes gene_type:complete